MEKLKEYEIKSKGSSYKGGKITCNADAVGHIRKLFKGSIDVYESFFMLFLNRANETVGYAKISQGGITGTVVDRKIVAKYIADVMPSGIIVCHNHPSGNVQPSNSDREMTKVLIEICRLFDVTFMDHIILTENNYYSFKENNENE